MSLWAAKLMYNSNAKGRHTPTEASVASGVYCQHGRDATLHCEGDTHPWCRSHTFGACRPPPHLGGTPAKNNHRDFHGRESGMAAQAHSEPRDGDPVPGW